jgi:GAF domain-containing protein
LTVQAPVESQDETGQLATAFNSMTTQLRGLIGSLEEQVQERTAELALSMEVGQRAAAIRDIAELLPTITEFIREQFELYYVHVYFVDDLGQNLVIQSGTGAVGKELMARHHTLPVGPGSIVGHVAAEGQSIVVSDTGDSDIHKPNPLLPDTRSEVAIPLIVEQRVMGVLDMQASQANTFSTNNLTVFEAMATQLAISIDSARQWVLAQEAQQRSEEALRQLTRETWAETLAQRKQEVGFAYDLASITPLEPTGQASEALKRPEREQNGGVSSVPLSVQNEPIGYLAVKKPADRPWSEDEQLLLEGVAQQLAQRAENLRLFDETQQRATREQIARQIADRIRASRDIETALKTAAEQLSRALGVPRAVVDLKVAPEASDEDGKEQ